MWGDLRRRAISIATGLVATGVVAALLGPGAMPAQAAGFDPNAAEQQLFTLINQDRAQNGLGPLVQNPTLFNIARGAPHQVCGGGLTFHGRAQDMIERGYFSHQIPSCNLYVWPILDSYGVQYSSAGENIGWNTDSPQATSTANMNTAFMNSAGHRANILGSYNQVGLGAWAAPGPWSDGSGGPYNGVIMYVEIFINGPLPAPVSPTNVTATPGNGSAVVSWTAPVPAAGITSYTVTPYSNGGATAGTAVSFGPSSTTVVISGLLNGTSYTFKVAATNAAGVGPQSAASNPVTPSASYPVSAVSTAQYMLANNDGRTWADLDTTNLALSFTPAVDSLAVIGANADLWTETAGVNQDLGISINGTLAAWKESGGFAGVFSPNAAFVQTVYAMAAGTSYAVKLQWKANKGAPGSTIVAGAGPAAPFSPTRLTVQLISKSANSTLTAVSTQQYMLSNSSGSVYSDIDASNLSLNYTPPSSGIALLSANADLWTMNAGFNQDLGISVNGTLAGWKESGGFAGTFSPNAAFAQAAYPMTAGTNYSVKLQWKTNKPGSGATIVAGAGTGPFSPTRLTLRFFPSGNGLLDRVSTAQYRMSGSDGSSWTDLDAAALNVSFTPTNSCVAVVTANADLFTGQAGVNQDLGIDVNGVLIAWKESGGFAGTFSPNAAFVETAVALSAGTAATIKLRWKTNVPAGAATIYAAAGPAAPFSPTRVTAELIGC